MPPKEKRVLLIDHSGTSLAIINKLISKNIPNVTVDVTMHADEAFQLLKEHKYSLITTSRNMPDIDCHALVNTIRKDLSIRTTPLIVISGEIMGHLKKKWSVSW